jgi:hypothetical protein
MPSSLDLSQAAELSQAETRILNQAVFEKLSSSDPLMLKEAVDAVNDFTRTRMREDGFMRQILPAVPITNDELDRQIETDKPVKIVDKEPDSPAAISIPFATLPMNLYIKGNRYPVTMQRIVTPRFTKDVDELRTWIMDIRQVLSDNAIKDMLAEEDSKLLAAANTAMVGQGVTVPTSGTVQWGLTGGGITRDGLCDMLKRMPSTPSHLEVHTVLLNNITIKDVMKFGRTEMGGDLSQDIMKSGWSASEFLGATWIITIKTDLVATSTFYHWSDPKFIGKHYELEGVTMYIRREAYMLEFFAYQTSGATLGHTNGLTREDFN